MTLFDRDGYAGDHQDHAVGSGREALVGQSQQVAEPQPDRRLGMHAFADFVGDESDIERRSGDEFGQGIDLTQDFVVGFATQQPVGHPDRGAIHDRGVHADGQSVQALDDVEGLLDGAPVPRALGTMACDASRQVGVPRLRCGDERHVTRACMASDRVAALAAPGSPKDK